MKASAYARSRRSTRRSTFPTTSNSMDGGTLGLSLLPYVETSRRVLVFDAIDFGLAPGELKVLRDDEVPAWGARKMSPHQNGFNDVLALAHLHGARTGAIVAIGVQPQTLDDFGGSLTAPVRARLRRGRRAGCARTRTLGLPRRSAHRRGGGRRAERAVGRPDRLRKRASRSRQLPAASATPRLLELRQRARGLSHVRRRPAAGDRMRRTVCRLRGRRPPRATQHHAGRTSARRHLAARVPGLGHPRDERGRGAADAYRAGRARCRDERQR